MPLLMLYGAGRPRPVRCRRLAARSWLAEPVTAGVLLAIANGKPGYSLGKDGLAANGYGAHSPGHYTLASGLLTEIVMTAAFLVVIMAVTGRGAPAGFGPLAIGLALTLIHLISIPVTNTSVNPARSTGPAIFVHGWALTQLWLFWVAPLIGAAIAGFGFLAIFEDRRPLTTEAQGVADNGTAVKSHATPANSHHREDTGIALLP